MVSLEKELIFHIAKFLPEDTDGSEAVEISGKLLAYTLAVYVHMNGLNDYHIEKVLSLLRDNIQDIVSGLRENRQ